ncbi:MAG: DUF4340 domain-containing protein [bacterium]
MKFKQLAILGLCAAVLVIVAVKMSRNETHRTSPSQIGNLVLPDLGKSVNDIATILIRSSSATTRIARVEGIWRVPGKYAYPADFSKVRDLLTKLVDLKILQALRASPSLLTELQLEAGASTPESATTLIELQDPAGKTRAALRIGKPRVREPAAAEASPYGAYPDGRFVATDNNHVYLVGDALNECATPEKDWLDSEFLNVNASDVTSVEVTGLTSGVVRVDRASSPGGELTLKELPPDQTADPAKLTSLAAALSYLRFEEIADPKLTPEQTGLDKPVVFKGITRQGEVYTVRVGKSPEGDTRRYVSATVAFEAPPTPAPGTNATQVAALKAEAEAQKKTADAAQQLNAKLSPWVYLINSLQAEAMTKGRADLIAVKQEKNQATIPEAP